MFDTKTLPDISNELASSFENGTLETFHEVEMNGQQILTIEYTQWVEWRIDYRETREEPEEGHWEGECRIHKIDLWNDEGEVMLSKDDVDAITKWFEAEFNCYIG